MFFHLLPIISFLALVGYVVFYRTSFFMISFPLLRIMGLLLLSTSVADIGNIYLFEIDKFSRESYSSYYLLFLYLLTLSVIYFVYQKVQNYDFKIKLKYQRLISISILLILIVLVLHILYSGAPLLIGRGKSEFWGYAALPILSPFSSQLIIYAFVSGVIYYNSSKLLFKRLAIINLGLVLIYLFLLGHKFGQPLYCIYYFILPGFIYVKSFDIQRYSRFIPHFSGGILLIGGMIYSYYYRVYGDSAILYLLGRIMGQGQLWNYFYETKGIIYIGSFTDFINGWSSGVYGSTMDYMMSLSMPTERYISYQSSNVNLAGGYPTILILFSDSTFLQVGFHFIISCTIALVLYVLYKSLVKKWYIVSILCIKVSFSLFSFYGMGTFSTIFNSDVLLYSALLCLSLFIRSDYLIKKKKSIYAVIARNTNY